MKHLVVTIGLFLISFSGLSAQNDFYNIDEVQEIRILFEQDNWSELLDSFYVAGEKERLLGKITINGETLDSVGIRYKGFSSVAAERTKNPFNIKLDYVRSQDYQGIDKIKLGNVIHDPSFVREALSYEIARNYMPASEANFARVYVNGAYLGLYSNVEAVNKEFVAKHFNSNSNAFFKGAPDDISFDGDNANLSNAPGMDTLAYKEFYDKESDDGWEELVAFIQVLNTTPENIEQVLNIDRALWMHAFNYVLVNLDSYIGYAQNYYLYQDDFGNFNTIPWDLNMSFGSFRITDASEFFDGLSIRQAKTLDPLSHLNSFSVSPRPLMRKLFENATYKRMYLAHIRTIVDEHFVNGAYKTRIALMQDVIREAVIADINKFYSDDGFESNVTATYNDLIDYPGLTDLMDARAEYLLSYAGISETLELEPTGSTVETTKVTFTAKTTNASSAFVAYRTGSVGPFVKKEMEQTSSYIWHVDVPIGNRTIEYYFYAENDIVGQFSPSRAAYEVYTAQPNSMTGPQSGELVINEFMASNETTVTDEAGEYDDWIELYNTTDQSFNLSGLYLSDKAEQIDKWALPDTTIQSGEYLIIWADEDGSQGPMHANFKLSSGGEHISLAYAAGAEILDSITYGSQTTDLTTGRYPNGSGPFVSMSPTFNSPNSRTNTEDDLEANSFQVFPNPSIGECSVYFGHSPNEMTLRLIGASGILLDQWTLDTQQIKLNLTTYPSGLYTLQVNTGNRIYSKLIVKI